MKYYVVSDVHGFYTHWVNALKLAGFFEEKEPCKVVVCGDLLDRGPEAVKTVEFALKLLEEDKLIYIRGNHEDLFENLVEYFEKDNDESFIDVPSHHISNGTWDTLIQLTGIRGTDALLRTKRLVTTAKNTLFWRKLLPETVDYFETKKYVFTHGYIPHKIRIDREKFQTCWRLATDEEWKKARWYNGMEVACGMKKILPDKTVVVGHWHTSFGHYHYEKKGSEFGPKADFSPFYAEGIIALDACTAFSGKMNCIVLKDELEDTK